MPKSLTNLKKTCNFYPLFSVDKNFPKKCKIPKKRNGKCFTVSGVIQPEFRKFNLGFPYVLVTEFGTFHLSASDDFLELFNAHEWEEFIIKGMLIGSLIRVKSAKLIHRPEPDMEDFSQLDDSIIYEKIPANGVLVELENDVA